MYVDVCTCMNMIQEMADLIDMWFIVNMPRCHVICTVHVLYMYMYNACTCTYVHIIIICYSCTMYMYNTWTCTHLQCTMLVYEYIIPMYKVHNNNMLLMYSVHVQTWTCTHVQCACTMLVHEYIIPMYKVQYMNMYSSTMYMYNACTWMHTWTIETDNYKLSKQT